MSQIGMGVLLKAFAGPPAEVDTSVVLGKRISSASLTESALLIRLEDGYGLRITDEGQSCCEHRYMTCDDDLKTYEGATLVSISVEDGPDVDDSGGDAHETQFLRVSTDAGTIVVCTHNEHNGYYGGFYIQAQVLAPDDKAVA